MHKPIGQAFMLICSTTLIFSAVSFADGISTKEDEEFWILMMPAITGKTKPPTIIPPKVPYPLNDTGTTWAGDYPSGGNAMCTSTISGLQDCHYGRDATHNNNSDGHAGFSYTKLDAKGQSLPASAASWSCVRDNVTGLVWEVKTNDGSIHDKDNTYRWGGRTARGAGYGTYYNDWNSLVDGSNNQRLCGFSNWRLPTRVELQSIVLHDGKILTRIDTTFFPNMEHSDFWSDFWSASPVAKSSTASWYVNFNDGFVGGDYRSKKFFVLLVRSSK